MNKELKDLSFDELVKFGVELELDAIVKGETLKNRVYQLMEIATRWRHEQILNSTADSKS